MNLLRDGYSFHEPDDGYSAPRAEECHAFRRVENFALGARRDEKKKMFSSIEKLKKKKWTTKYCQTYPFCSEIKIVFIQMIKTELHVRLWLMML